MSAGDVPRCPSCGLYLYPSDTATVHLCGVPYPNNAPASYPLKDWRDAEIESLRTDYVLLSDDYKQLLGDNERLRSRLAEADALLRETREEIDAPCWSRPIAGFQEERSEFLARIDAHLGREERRG
jgi:hypothetical protein